MARIVNVHHMDKAAFLKGNAECVDPKEVVMVFTTSPTYAEVVERIRFDLKWMEPSDACELIGRYNAGFGHHNRLKIMPVDSELNWSAYKEIVEGSQDKSLELFATRKFVARLSIDLNRHASPCARDEPSEHRSADVYDTRMSQPPMSQPPMSPIRNDQYEEEETEGGNYEGDDAEHGLRENEVGDVEANFLEEDMDHDLPYLRSHASDSEDKGPGEDVDEDGLTAKEAATHKKVVGLIAHHCFEILALRIRL
jgi:hypothetical protein